MGSHSVTCHPTQVNVSHLDPNQTLWHLIYLHQRDGRMSWPWCWLYIGIEMVHLSPESHPSIPSINRLIATWLGVEPVTSQSQVKRSITPPSCRGDIALACEWTKYVHNYTVHLISTIVNFITCTICTPALCFIFYNLQDFCISMSWITLDISCDFANLYVSSIIMTVSLFLIVESIKVIVRQEMLY